jgi:hypothetical protein
MAISVLSEEERWWRANSMAQVSVVGDTLILWNYPVARAELTRTHMKAIDDFTAISRLARGSTSEVKFCVRGHASASGEQGRNVRLAQERANQVGNYLFAMGVIASRADVEITSAGSNEPVDGGSSGFSFARNRRVELVKLQKPSKPKPGEPEGFDPVEPLPPTEKSALRGAEYEFETEFGPVRITAGWFILDVSSVGTIKGTVTGSPAAVQDAGLIVGPSSSNGKASATFQSQVLDDIVGKIQIEPPESGIWPPKVAIQGEFQNWKGSPEFGVQMGATPVYATYKFEDWQMERTTKSGAKLVFTLEGKIKVAVGLSSAGLAKLANLEATFGRTAAAEGFAAGELSAAGIGGSAGVGGILGVLGGGIAVFALVTAGTARAVEGAKEAADEYTALLAQRDGRACRVAYHILSDDTSAALSERKQQWKSAGSALDQLAAFDTGVKDVALMLQSQEARDAKTTAWKVKYQGDGETQFGVLRHRVFMDIGGYEKNAASAAAL